MILQSNHKIERGASFAPAFALYFSQEAKLSLIKKGSRPAPRVGRKQKTGMNAIAILLLLAFACPLAAQWQRNSRGSTDAKTQRLRIVQGKIVAEDNSPISGATITIENQRRMFHREVRSDRRGQWRATGILAMAGEEFRVTIRAPRCLTRSETIRFVGDREKLHSEMHPDPRLQVVALFAQAAQARRDQRYDEALSQYERILVVDNDNVQARLGIGFCQQQLGQLAPAEESLRQSPPQAEMAAADDAAASDRRLAAILKLAAGYCRRLKTVAFKYFCTETVEEKTWPGRPNTSQNQYQYDYQIIGKKQVLEEQRFLLQENGRRVKGGKSGQKSLFQTSLMFFSPIDLLALENQPLFNYRLLGSERAGNQDGLLLDVRAKYQSTEMPLLEGRVLLNAADGSVMRIEVAPTAIIGVAERRTLAAVEGYPEIEIHNIHWYDTEKNGLRFPSHSEMREIYSAGGLRTLHYVVKYTYSNYRFFQVEMEVMNAKDEEQ